MTDMRSFNPSYIGKLGQLRMEEGKEKVASHNSLWLKRMRQLADDLIGVLPVLTADDLQEQADLYEDWPDHDNAWGSVFNDGTWEAVGFRKSKRPAAHARMIREWRKKK